MARRSYGTGSLYTRADTAGREKWYGKWWSNGRQVQRRLGPVRSRGSRDGLTRAQAEAELRRAMAETPAVRSVGERLTVGELGRRYAQHLEQLGRKHSTLIAVRSAIRVHLEPFFGSKAVQSIRREDVEDLMALMRSNGLTRKSIRNYVSTLSAIFTFAERRELVESNPCRGVDLPTAQVSEDIRFLDIREVDALIDRVADGPYRSIDRSLYLAAALTGMRQGELIALRWRDVDWQAGLIRVRRNYVRGKFGTPKSRRSSRSVPLDDRLAGELDRLSQQSRFRGDDDLVFADPHTGGPLQREAIVRQFRRALKAAHLNTAHRFHDLRHTFGTLAIKECDPRELQELMGHRSIATTMIYADYAPSRDLAAKLSRAFSGLTLGTNPGTNLSESQSTSEQPSAAPTPETT